MLQAACNGILIFGARQDEIGGDAEALETLAHDVFEQLAGAVAADGVGIENADGGVADGTGLEDWAAILEDADDGIQLILGYGKWSALDGGDALADDGVAEVWRGS